MSGSVRIARAVFDDPAFKDEAFSEREAFIWLIMEASFKRREKRVGHSLVTLERGQLSHSLRFMAGAWKWSEPRVRRYLERLENRRMIECAADAGVTVVTVCKYDKYQSQASDDDADAPASSTQQRRNTDANENKGEIRILGGRDAHAREADPIPQELPTFRERILDAMGVDRSGMTGRGGTRIGTAADMEEVRRWIALGVSAEEILTLVAETASGKRDGPPKTFSYFTPAMTRFAAVKAAPPLSPDDITNPQRGSQNAQSDHANRLQRIITTAAAGTSGKDWG